MMVRELSQRGESIDNLDAIERRMTVAIRDDRCDGAACGSLREVVMTVRPCATQRDEYRSSLDRARIDAHAPDVAPDAGTSTIARLDRVTGGRARPLPAAAGRHLPVNRHE